MKVPLLMTGSMLFVFALGGALQAQNRGPDRDNRGQKSGDYRGPNHSKFDDHDRQTSRDWYSRQNHKHPPMGLRERDQLTPEYQSRFQVGYVLDRNMRRRIYPVPADYDRTLPPPPRGYRYVFIGGNAALIDSGYRVHDVIHFELNF